MAPELSIYLVGSLTLQKLSDSRLELLDIQLRCGMLLGQLLVFMFLLLVQIVGMSQSSTVKVEFRLHRTDRLLILLDDRTNDLLILRRPGHVALG